MTPSFQSSFVVAGVTAIAVLAISAGVAAAHQISFPTTAAKPAFEDDELPEAGDPFDSFYGYLSSTKAACEAGRQVRLFREAGSSDQLVGTAQSYRRFTRPEDGFWQVPAEDPGDGTYYALVTRKVLANSTAHRHVCSADRSPNLQVEDDQSG